MSDFTDHLRPSHDGPAILAKERAQSNIPVDELAHHLLSKDGHLQRQARILSILEKEPLFDKKCQANLSREDLFKVALARAKLLRRLVDRHGWSLEDYKMAEALVDDVSPYFLHMHMFVTTVREQASDTQRDYWMPLIESFKIIGAYAQTELGHGSNVQGLELQARWDPGTSEFILHSPTLTASKWWNGSLGRTANHAIVVAQLLLPKPGSEEYESVGPHPFIVQVRDLKHHQPLSGVVIGDIGPKFGYSTIDNAYMLFNHFRIPHSALLARYSKIDPSTGEYLKPKIPAVVYGTMTYVRSLIVLQSRLALARAVTIAVRYTSIRRQFQDRDNRHGLEVTVLDYPTVQIRILPLLATTYVLHYAGLAMQRTYQNARNEIERGDFSGLAHMHSLSSGLKSLCTGIVADGIETCRRALGGHGYGGASGFTRLSPDYLSRVTVEGDNWMITQQVASYLIKRMQTAANKLDEPTDDGLDATYKEVLKAHRDGLKMEPYKVFDHDSAIVKAFNRRAAALLHEVYVARVLNKTPWTSLMVQLHRVSHAQSLALLVEIFYDTLNSDQSLAPPIKVAMWNLYRLFAFYHMQQESYDFYRSGAVSQNDLDGFSTHVQHLMEKIRPHAVTFVDAWMIPDYLLDSALGRYDGKVYEDLYYRAHRLNPLNRITVNPNYWEDEIVKGEGNSWASLLAKL
ncbi:fatty-acyl coenzyme A oxidase (Pox1) [Aspergillus bombycis]|uniref:Acyl-coenzyme A oxidase n=1 Tax=Aspergillus bombycis TaxID=109264 RepID=A0A1F7ZJM9_9EURO|nr:fatty-acyl coenzyme A oxidase (Pox1) [Aspergillus bombycis]OGM39650.1 fatty-acyl coenzyme A oxidase (Pox1) [Aspergillus bombycis]